MRIANILDASFRSIILRAHALFHRIFRNPGHRSRARISYRLSNSSILLAHYVAAQKKKLPKQYHTNYYYLQRLRKSSRGWLNFGHVRESRLRIFIFSYFYTKLSKAVGSFPTRSTCSRFRHLFNLPRGMRPCSHLNQKEKDDLSVSFFFLWMK